jgi:signal transduction histidine kinase
LRLTTNSLAFRLVASAAVWSIIGLVAGGFALSGIFRSQAEEAFDDQMMFHLESLIAAAETDKPGHVKLDDGYIDMRFSPAFSGWYWQIDTDPPKPVAQSQRSRSLWDQVLTPGPLGANPSGHMWGLARGPDGQDLRVLRRRIVLPAALPGGKTENRAFLFTVAGDRSESEADIASFNETLAWSLAALGLGLILAMIIQVRVGLLPLRRVSEALGRIREGRARSLEGKFPAEIAPLATELNSLIAHSAEVVGRARTHVSNLAHFLKTPLTVLHNEADQSPGPLAEMVQRQVGLMRRQVDHYLARARAAGALDVLGNRTEVKRVAEDLARVLTRMHTEKKIAIEVRVTPGLAFRGEREDLEEMVGNLIDNACKWARGKVAVNALPLDDRRFVLTVVDDGPGLPAEERARAMERGEKLDESMEGSGLGLAIVRDIAKLYGGNFELSESPLGGLAARLELPRAR